MGYSNTWIKESINEQLEKLPYCSLFEHTNQTAIKAANKILDIAESHFQKVMFTCSGSECVELSIKLMRKYWKMKGASKKSQILTLEYSYHGTYYGGLTASNIESEFSNDYGPLVPDFYSLSSKKENKDAKESSLECLDEAIEYIKKSHEKIAGIIIEPILASNSVDVLQKEYIEGLCRACRQYNILIAVDEIATGFYRTGKVFYYRNFNIVPDLVCTSKGLNSGYLPVGAVLVSEYIIKTFEMSNDILIHGSTQDGNLLCCASIIAALEQYKELNISENVCKMSVYLMDAIKNAIGNVLYL